MRGLTCALREERKAIAISSGGTSSTALKSRVLRVIQSVGNVADVADFGAGRGELLGPLIQCGRFSSITAFDLLDRPAGVPPEIHWFTADLNESVPCAAESFDLIISLGVIEYMENPYSFTREVCRSLRAGGTAIFSTPNNESWRSLISLVSRGHFVAFPPDGRNVNLTALVRCDFEKTLRLAGFRDIRFIGSGHGMLPKLKVSWQSLFGGLLRGIRYSDDLIVTAHKP